MDHNRDDKTLRGPRVGRRETLLAVAGTAALVAASRSAHATSPYADTDVLNFLLNLEYLEAEYFSFAVYGHGLPAQDVVGAGTQGVVTGGAKANLGSVVADYARKLAQDDLGHIRYLRALIGTASVVAEPRIDIGVAFTNLAIAAGLIVSGQTFDPYKDDISFLLGASVFTDVIASAYAWASAMVSRPIYRQAVTAIGIVEGYHAGAVRTNLANLGAGVAFGLVANLISVLSAGSPGGAVDPGLLVPGNSHNFVPDNAYGLVNTRSPSGVLRVFYGAPSGTGLFYPNGLNGLIH